MFIVPLSEVLKEKHKEAPNDFVLYESILEYSLCILLNRAKKRKWKLDQKIRSVHRDGNPLKKKANAHEHGNFPAVSRKKCASKYIL